VENTFDSWIGQTVVVRLALGTIKLSLRGIVLRELTESLIFRPEAGCDLEIPKVILLAVEEVGRVVPGPLRMRAWSTQE
jgi:hypothetical protein